MFDLPAEWDKQDAMWTAWPSHPERWKGKLLAQARDEVAALVRAVAAHQKVRVFAHGTEALTSAKAAIGASADVASAEFGDIWFRDTGPVFAYDEDVLLGLRFRTNGWGGKFIYEYDDQVGDAICAATKARMVPHDFVLEGGSIEHNGAGTIMTTRECILNPNRNPSWSEHDAEHALKQAFHADRLVWIDFGMKNDHTDGHIDNIARFVGEDHVVCQKPYGSDDPNALVFAAISQRLKSEGFRVSEITSPGLVKDDSGEVVPASHMNFVIANGIIVVPTYGGPSTAIALAELQKVFPDRRVVGSSSRAVLTGGGSFHCITQQQPARRLL